ncbi:MMPL family transporter [Lachnospira sp. NSJ-43]|jgi:predicted RND superfamily exporter protein|uniref:MMPL family transporter n=3 Tax=Lachnospira TaxID=28050 RepID=A0ABR7G1P5_9FIRM|nr:MMPL family transporter [Lachnospira hominis]
MLRKQEIRMKEQEKKKKGNLWLTVATFIVNKRKAIEILFVLAIIYSVLCINKVQVNQDITSYLPADSETRQGLSIMDEQFMTYGSAKVMLANVTFNQADSLVDSLENVDGVKEVAFDDSSDHFKGTNALFDITFSGTSDEQVSKDALNSVKDILADYDVYVSTEVGSEESSAESLAKDMNIILVLAVVVIVAVLLLSTKAYLQIPVLLITFGVAAILNMGTNYWFGTISSITNSIAVVLQLALAIDYAIILCDRFMEEHETLDAEEAVKVALSKAIPEISSSSLTTISGMVAMMFMQFRLGYDMGIILVKAIILSLISVFFLMPGVLLIFAKGIDKTHHKCYVPKITIVGKFANKTKYIIPPLFIICLVFAFMKSNNCQYIYDTSSIVSAKKSESKIAQETIEETFGASNQLVVMVPKGDYESEHKVVKKLQNLDYVTSALALSNVSINDEYVLTDKLSPRQFSELVGIDREVVEVLYMAYAYNQEQYGPVVTGIDDYDVPIIDMFLFLYDQYKEGYVTLDSNLDEKLTTLYDTLHDAQLQLQGSDYSRLVLNISLPVEGQETYDALEEIRGIAAQYYSKDSVILVGNSTSDHDLESSFASDNIIISVLTALFVMIILFFTFQSAGLPVLLVLTIQGSIWINFAVPSIEGQTVFFIAYLIVSAIQMGATIDYAIVISNRYLQLKQQMPLKEAITETLNQSFPTIFTSGSILTCAGFLIGEIASDATVASIGVALGRGTLISIILVLFVLPQILLMGDIIIEKTALTMNITRPQREVAGRVRVTGHVRGYVQGEIDADIQGTFQGQMKVSVDSVIPGRQGQIEQNDLDSQQISEDDDIEDNKAQEGDEES